jgi:hypothetical protein
LTSKWPFAVLVYSATNVPSDFEIRSVADSPMSPLT